jgi:hypothetical protein
MQTEFLPTSAAFRFSASAAGVAQDVEVNLKSLRQVNRVANFTAVFF